MNLELKASIDEDLELSEDGKINEKYARLNLNWNIFNGNKDRTTSIQERLFLQEQKKTLDDITNDVIAEVKSLYNKHDMYKNRVEQLKKYVEANVNILEVYRNEFEAGTRTFVDILNAESELYESTKLLIEIEYALIDNYYDLMFNLSSLTDSILYSQKQDCANIAPRVIEYKPKQKDNEISQELKELIGTEDSDLIKEELGLDLAKELNLETQTTKTTPNDNEEKSINADSKSFLNAPKDSYTLNIATFNNIEDAKKFIEENSLEDKATAFSFGKNNKAKIILGSFNSVKDAKKVLNTLPNSVLANKPYIDNIYKHQKLYNKYN